MCFDIDTHRPLRQSQLDSTQYVRSRRIEIHDVNNNRRPILSVVVTRLEGAASYNGFRHTQRFDRQHRVR